MNETSVKKEPILRWSIGTKLIIAFLALAVIPMSVTAYYNLTQGRKEVAKVAKENLIGLSRSTAYRIGQLLVENQRTSATLAGEPLVAQFLAASEEERQALTPQIYQILKNFADTHPDYDAPGLLDVNGIVIASLADILVGKDRSFRDYFQASIKGKPFISGMLVGRATGRPGVFLTNPVITTQGKIVGIDIVWLKGDTIWRIIDDVTVGKKGIAHLIDQDGVIIAHPNRDLLYHSLGKLTPEATAIISRTIRFGTIKGTKTPVVPESLGMDEMANKLMSAQGSGTYRYYSPLDHRKHVVGYTRMEAHPWTVVVDLPEGQFLAPLQRLRTVTWASVGLVAAITLFISIMLVRGIVRPIRRLTDVAIAVEKDHSFEPSDIEDVTSGRDEIALMGQVFSVMVLSLRKELAERKQAEEELTKSLQRERFWADIVRNASVGVAIGYPDGHLGMSNVAYQKITCYSEKELQTLDWNNILTPPEWEESETAKLQELHRTKKSVQYEKEYIRKNGSRVPVELLVHPRFDSDGNVECYFAFVIDITDRKQAEEELKKHRDHLEELVKERTGELDKRISEVEQLNSAMVNLLEDLRVSNDMLEMTAHQLQEANKERESFSYSVSHDLRAPLRAIDGFSQILVEDYGDKLDENGQHQVDVIQGSARQMGQLIDDLLTFSRMGRKGMSMSEIDMGALVGEVFEQLQLGEAERTARLNIDTLPPAPGDRAMIREVLVNFLSNAMKFTRPGKLPVIEVTGRVDENENVYSVKDKGVGFDMKYADKLFQVFQRLHSAEEYEGTGIGLALVQRIIRRHGGRVWAEGKVNKGATFYFSLPRS